MTDDVVADTHALLWSIFEPTRLSPAAATALSAAAERGIIYIATISLVEVSYLSGKKKFEFPDALATIYAMLADPGEPLRSLALTVAVARALESVPRNEVPDMPDRIIAATAVQQHLPLVSVDSDIRGSAALAKLIKVIW